MGLSLRQGCSSGIRFSRVGGRTDLSFGTDILILRKWQKIENSPTGTMLQEGPYVSLAVATDKIFPVYSCHTTEPCTSSDRGAREPYRSRHAKLVVTDCACEIIPRCSCLKAVKTLRATIACGVHFRSAMISSVLRRQEKNAIATRSLVSFQSSTVVQLWALNTQGPLRRERDMATILIVSRHSRT